MQRAARGNAVNDQRTMGAASIIFYLAASGDTTHMEKLTRGRGAGASSLLKKRKDSAAAPDARGAPRRTLSDQLAAVVVGEAPPPESPKRRKFVAPDKDRPHAFGDCVVQSRSAAGPTTTKKKHDDEGRLRAARALLESQHSESQSQDSEPQKRASVLCYTSLASSQGPDLPGAWAAKFDASQRPSPEDA